MSLAVLPAVETTALEVPITTWPWEAVQSRARCRSVRDEVELTLLLTAQLPGALRSSYSVGAPAGLSVCPRFRYSRIVKRGAVARRNHLERIRHQLVQLRRSDVHVRCIAPSMKR